ncbi:MAG: hypothetical protein HY720_30840, partial [Planctomycetes bacterium]|nr:hypothetical protein [Planctomycetota bacterium]
MRTNPDPPAGGRAMTLRSPRLAAIRSPWSLVLGLLFFAAFVPARAQEGADGADWTQRYFAGPPDEDLMVSEHGTLRWAGLLGDRRLRHAGAVGCVAVSPDGKWIVSGSWDTTLKVWDTETGREFRSLVGHENWVSAVAVSPDGKWMVSGSWDKTLKVWDAETGRELRSLAGHKEVVLA